MAWRRAESASVANRLNGQPIPGNPSGPFDPPPQQYGAYADPPPGYPVNNPLGWSPGQYQRPVNGAESRVDRYPDPTRPVGDTYGPRDANNVSRTSVETVDGDGWTIQKGVLPSDRRWAYNPRLTPPPEPRPTLQMGPRTYSYTRPFDQLNRQYGDDLVGTKRQFNGTHFSMASHRRTYPILGMEPARRSMRNTYRLTPAPWDTDLVDLPPVADRPRDTIRSSDVPAPSRAYRLG